MDMYFLVHKETKYVGNYVKEYSWIADQRHAHKKSIFRQTRGVTTLPRPPLESSRLGESRSAVTIFVKSIVGVLFSETYENMAGTKIVMTDLDSPRRIL